jgi:hypothetical protein
MPKKSKPSKIDLSKVVFAVSHFAAIIGEECQCLDYGRKKTPQNANWGWTPAPDDPENPGEICGHYWAGLEFGDGGELTAKIFPETEEQWRKGYELIGYCAYQGIPCETH